MFDGQALTLIIVYLYFLFLEVQSWNRFQSGLVSLYSNGRSNVSDFSEDINVRESSFKKSDSKSKHKKVKIWAREFRVSLRSCIFNFFPTSHKNCHKQCTNGEFRKYWEVPSKRHKIILWNT
jgi:hypothetical protein